jgi:uncharacterized protein YjbI with pentapeptide repeats
MTERWLNQRLVDRDLGETDLVEADPRGCRFERCMSDFFLTAFRECKLTGSMFTDADSSQTTIAGRDWSLVNLRSCNLLNVRMCSGHNSDMFVRHAAGQASDPGREHRATIQSCQLAPPDGLEPPARKLEASCSIR